MLSPGKEPKELLSLEFPLRRSSGYPKAQVALNQAMALPADPSLDELLIWLGGEGFRMTDTSDLAMKEVEVARQFNAELPLDLAEAVLQLEEAVASLTSTRKNVILLLNPQTDTYHCLNDEALGPDSPKREVTWISDHFLQDLLGVESVLHTDLQVDGRVLGIVAVAEKENGLPFNGSDVAELELVARYLAPKVAAYQRMKTSQSLPAVQTALLEVSRHLVSAVDRDDVISGLLRLFGTMLGFQVCQYVAIDPDSGEGRILYEYSNEGPTARRGGVAGLSRESFRSRPNFRVVKEYASLVTLFASMASHQPHLWLKGRNLGDKSLAELFGVQKAESALILPVMDLLTGRTCGTFTLFHTRPTRTVDGRLDEQVLTIAQEITAMASRALSRTLVLEKALALASSDELTGLTNRRGFYERFEIEIERSRRNPSAMCVVMIDVDHFKRLNDTYGHLAGDRVLKALADLFQQNVRRSDVVCRFGGEEFAFLLPDTHAQSACELLERIRKKVERLRIRGSQGEAIRTTISAGVMQVDVTHSMGRPLQEVISEALTEADEALYQAKSSGRNRICQAESAA